MKSWMQWLIAAGIALTCVVVSVGVGAFPLTVAQMIGLIFHPGEISQAPEPGIVFWQIRLPRIAAALLIGAGLSAAGAAYQGIFRNPLVSPDILGVSAGAGLGASLAILLEMPVIAIQAFAFVGGLVVVTLATGIARMARRHDAVLSLVLVGIALGALCGAAISLIKVISDPYTQLPTITFWLLGSLSAITRGDLMTAGAGIIAGLMPLLLLRWRVNLLSLPDEEAQALGVNVTRIRVLFIVCATLVTASAVAVAGVIGWVGLVVPHICRLLVGANYLRLLPLSLFCGGLFLLLTDTLARTLGAIELPLGILTSFTGAPFFLLLLLRGGRR
ncbi:iron ABC transporter permease [Pantoea sp. BAV 3049]|uniref:FecCD family ABC transporter permease n=1 Tax=Pantoea sp. BAV 3049 TaxID=2654188 RepID=UPI00131BB53A|nr:iron ABC transporter permease [Pantoea sp. BAV 3049]